MAKGYWIAMVDVKNPEGYKGYTSALQAVLKKFGGRYLSRGGKTEVVEGKVKPRIVTVEFPSYEAAMNCYRDADYQKIVPIRTANAEADLVVMEGYDGAQP